MGVFFGALPAALITIFPLHVRFSGISLAHNMSMAIFGGITPLIAAFLLEKTNNLNTPAFLLMSAALLLLIGVVKLRVDKRSEDVFLFDRELKYERNS